MESNKLIAEFLGAKPISLGASVEYEMYGIIECIKDGVNEKHFFIPDEMEFKESWDWLMPVVRKIDNTITLSSKDESYLYCFDMVSENHVTIFDSLTSTTIVKVPFNKAYEREPVYKAVVEFIQWYNQKQ